MTKRLTLALGAALVLPLALARPSLAQPKSGEVLPPPVLRPAPAKLDPPGSERPPEWSEVVPQSDANRFWASADTMLMWMESTPLPTLVTTSPVGTDRTLAGIPGNSTTSTVFGGRVNDDMRWGFKVAGGAWLDADHTLAVEIGFTMLESQAALFSASSTGTPILARPYNDVTAGTPQAVLVAFPGAASGNIDVRASSANYYDAHLDFSEKFLDCCGVRLFSILGYRFFRYDDGLRVQTLISPTDPAVTPGTQIFTVDDFGAHNQFHGADLGLRAELSWEQLTLGLLAKAAVGDLRREVRIAGGQSVTAPGAATTTSTAGLFALSSNSGVHHSSDFEIMPEFGVNLGWQINSHVRVNLGYSLLFLNQIARSADQIDLNLTPALFPPATGAGTSPAFNLDRRDVWLQGINLGVEFAF
jgi:hypothetical protein